ncbi:MAG: hypothetical protein NT126_07915, partial [Bacteroidetes bacterium]|nr:hypothetical protein [Bacteroidota bacterium]
TTVSSGYLGASGSGNVFFGTSGGNDKNFIISGINTQGYATDTLSFGLLRTDLLNAMTVETSTDGTTYSPLSFTQPGAANLWTLIKIGGIPATANLRIRFSKNSTTSFRVDDVKLTGISSTVNIAVTGPTTICGTAGVRLTSNILTANVWSPNSETTKSILALASGTYSVTATGSNGCKSTSSPVVIQVNPSPSVSITSTTNPSCFGTSNGSATALASGGTGTLGYSWNSSPVQTTATASSLVAGTYTVTVTDANSCTATASATLTQPTAINDTAVISASTVCEGSTVNLSTTGTTSATVSLTNATPVAIPDSSVALGIVPVTSSIAVSGLNTSSLVNGQIASVKINSLTHTYDGDLIGT